MEGRRNGGGRAVKWRWKGIRNAVKGQRKGSEKAVEGQRNGGEQAAKGRHVSHRRQREAEAVPAVACPRAGWISTLLLKITTDAV